MNDRPLKESEHELTYFGHSSWRVDTAEGTTIIFDPFLEPNPLTPEDEKEQDECDVLVLTHGHFDHTSDALKIAGDLDCHVIATYELGTQLVQRGIAEDKVILMNTGGTAELDGIRYTLVPAYHSSATQFDEDSIDYAGSPNGVVLELEDGLTVYNSGDTWIFEEMKYIRRLYEPTVGMLCMGGHFTMDAQAAALCAEELLELDQVICQHHSTFPPLYDTPEDLDRELSDTDIVVFGPEPGETIELSE